MVKLTSLWYDKKPTSLQSNGMAAIPKMKKVSIFYLQVNIDEHGNKNFVASIRVTETDLELYQKGKDTIVWPLKSLRRYGFETEVFTFESGRRGPTGPGIYAFKYE